MRVLLWWMMCWWIYLCYHALPQKSYEDFNIFTFCEGFVSSLFRRVIRPHASPSFAGKPLQVRKISKYCCHITSLGFSSQFLYLLLYLIQLQSLCLLFYPTRLVVVLSSYFSTPLQTSPQFDRNNRDIEGHWSSWCACAFTISSEPTHCEVIELN